MDKTEKQIIEFYRDIFETEKGQLVLAHMLTELHFFDEIDSDEELYLSNYAKRLLRRVGVLNGKTIKDIVSKLLDINILKLKEFDDVRR